MYDFTNYQIADIPIFMWSMVAVTAGLIGYVTVSSSGSSGGESVAPASVPPVQMGGGRTRRKKTKHSRRHQK